MSLDDIRAREQKASHGPWGSFPGYGASGEGITSVFQKEAPGWIAACEPDQQGEWDGQFIAHARTDIPRLLAALDATLDLCTDLDDNEHEHVERCEGEPTCPACWARSIRKTITDALA